MKEKIKGFIFPTLITVPFMLIYYYLALPAINLRAIGFWIMLVLSIAVFIGSYVSMNNSAFLKDVAAWLKASANSPKSANTDYHVKINVSKSVKITLMVIAIIVAVVLLLCFVTSSKVFRAKAYQDMLDVVESDFEKDIVELDFDQIPVVDKDTAARLGNRKIGEVVALVSQFNVSNYYSQINYKAKPYRVTPLEYAGLLKWFSNKDEGIPYYVTIDMASQQTELVKLEEGMKYSPSEFFARDLERHIRFAYPTKMFENLSFEIDDNGSPYWVMSYYNYTIGIVGGKDIKGVILVDAVTGEMTDYEIEKVPQWIDLAYSAELIVEQADNWGTYKNGFFNSLFVQKDVVVTTEGYNYVAVDDDVWLYTGITSVVADESNIGFILVNMRTKEAKTYMINGAEEYSAMESAQGQIQEKNYTATFPILLNIADRPTYFISLKDNAGLVKSYAFVSVAEYHIVGVADTIEGAKNEYLRLLGVDNTENDVGSESVEHIGKVEKIATAVKNGNSLYYIKLESDDGIYIANITISDILPLIMVGDDISFTADENGKITEIKYTIYSAG